MFRSVCNRAALIFGFLICASVSQAYGEEYPNHPVRWVVPFSAGGPSDFVARVVAEKLPTYLNDARVVIDNKPGGATVIGTQQVFSAKPDGYVIGSVTDNLSINELLLKSVPYDFRELGYVTGLIKMPMVLAVRSDLEPNNLDEAIKYFKEHPQSLSYGTWGIGSGAHLFMEEFLSELGVEMVHAPFSGSAPAINALMAKHIDAVVLDLATVLPYHKENKVKVIAVTTKTRNPNLPSIESISEKFPTFDAYTWNGVAVPKDTPKEIMGKLESALHKTLQDDYVKNRLEQQGMTVWASGPEELKSRLLEEYKNAKRVIEQKGITLE